MRLLTSEDEDCAVSYGWACAGAENFAISSVFFMLTRLLSFA